MQILKLFQRVVSLLVLTATPLFAAPQPGLWEIDEESNGKPGRGFQIDTQGDVLIITFYGYELDGSPTFYLASGTFLDSRFEGELLTFSDGTHFGGNFKDASVASSAGIVVLEFDSTITGTIKLPGEESKGITRYSYFDVSQGMTGVFEGETSGIGPFSTDSSTFTLTFDGDNFSLIRDSFFSGECRFEGPYQLAGAAINASGEYKCSDFSEGEFVAEQLTVNGLGIYYGTLIRYPKDSNDAIVEVHAGL